MINNTLKKSTLGFLFIFLLNIFPSNINAAEVDNGLVIVDRKPWKISWVQEEQYWVLIANFEKGTLRTYFKNEPPEKGFGLSRNKKPAKQEFEFYFGKKFTSTNCQYEQWPDGAKCFAFMYEQNFEREGEKCVFGTTAVVEEVGDSDNEIRYAIYREAK